jgi:hypothetical protein
MTSVKKINKCSLRHCRLFLQKKLGRGSPFNVSYQNCCKITCQWFSKFCLKIFSSETTGPIAIKLLWNDPLMAPFQNCVRWSRLPTKMATRLKIEKGGWNYSSWNSFFCWLTAFGYSNNQREATLLQNVK